MEKTLKERLEEFVNTYTPSPNAPLPGSGLTDWTGEAADEDDRRPWMIQYKVDVPTAE